MADTKISALTGASTPLAGTEVLPIVQSGTTVKVSVANLTAGRSVAMAGGSFTDNITQSTAAKGVNFTANTPAAGMTSQLLNWYEEGTWTPQVYYQNGTDQTNSTNVTQVGNYTRVGNLVSVTCYLTWTITGSPANDNVGIKNLPFTIKNSANYYPVAAAILGGADTNPTYGGWMIQGQSNTKVALIVTGIYGENQGNEVGATGTKSLFFTMSYLV